MFSWKKLLSAFARQKPVAESPQAQSSENWLCFKRYEGQSYYLMLVNRGLLDNHQVMSMSWVSIEYRFLRRQLVNAMMPTPDMMNPMYAFEDFIEQTIASIDGQMAACQTGFGSRIVWFCAPNLKLEDMIGKLTGRYQHCPVDVSRGSFEQFESLLPTHLEKRLQSNESILRTLAEHGDDGVSPRLVMHWATGVDKQVAGQLCKALTSAGYTIEEFNDDVLRFSRVTSLSEDALRTETHLLVGVCEDLECFYDGWESPVIKSTLH